MPGFDDFTDAPLSSSWLDLAKRFLLSPITTAPSNAAQSLSHWIDPDDPIKGRATGGVRGVSSAFIESLGDAVSGLTSPVNLALSALSGGVAGNAGKLIARGAGGAQAVHGMTELGDHPGQGAADIALGALAMLPGGSKAGRIAREEPPQLLTGKQRFEPPGGGVSPIDPRFVGRERVPASVETEPSPFNRHGDGSGPDPLDPRFTGRERVPQSYSDAPLEPSPYTRFEPAGGGVDPTDPRFAGRPQGTRGAEYERDPFTSDLDRATQATFQDAPLDRAMSLDELDPHVPPQRPSLDDLDPHVAPAARASTRPLGLDDFDPHVEPSAAAPVETGGRAPAAGPAAADDVIRRFFRYGEAPVTATGKRKLLPEEYSRERGLEATGLGEPRDVPKVPGQFRPSAGLDPEIEYITRGSRYNDLPYEQRKAAITQDERYNHLLGDDSGFVDVHAIQEGLPIVADKLNEVRYGGMLSSPFTQMKNVAGNVGAIVDHAAQTALGGDGRGALQILQEFFSPQTVRDGIREYQHPSEAGRWGPETKDSVFAVPGRIMGAVDRAAKDALSRAGVGDELGHEITFTNDPKSQLGRQANELLGRNPILKYVVPFAKTATNVFERGLERTPILGSIAQTMSDGALQTNWKKQALGALAAGGGVYEGMNEQPADKSNPYLDALLGPLLLPFAAGRGVTKAVRKPGATSADAVNAAVDTILGALPGLDATSLHPSQIASQFVPNILRDTSALMGMDPKSYDTSHSFFGPALAKIPILNELLLHHKARHAPGAAKGAARAPRG
jgi:hypothetical protein